jgi:YVTN family beta-propeller protein
MHPNGKWLFASNGGDANVAVIDTQTFAVHTKVPVGLRPWNMAVTADGAKLYVAAGRSHAVSVIDANTFTALGSVPVGKLPWGAAAN